MKTESNNIPRWVVALGRGLAVLSIVFLVHRLFLAYGHMPRLSWGPRAILAFGAGVVWTLAINAAGSYVWSVLLRGGGVHIDRRMSFVIFGQAQVYKYLPGNVFQYLSRVALSRRFGLPIEPVLLSMGVETFVAAATALSIGGLGLVYAPDAAALGFLASGRARLVALLPVLLLGVSAPLVLPAVRRWLRERRQYVHPRRLLHAASAYALCFLLYGAVVQGMLEGFWQIDADLSWYGFAWRGALAWIAGFAVPGAPGGLGVREAVFAVLLRQHLPEGPVVATVLLLRVSTMLGEAIVLGLAHLIDRSKTPRGHGSGSRGCHDDAAVGA